MNAILKRTVGLTAGLLLASLVLASPPAAADNPKVNINFFRPSVHPGDLMGIQTSLVGEAGQWGAGFFMTFTNKPLRLIDGNGNDLFKNVTNMLIADVYGSIAVGNFLDIGLDVPVVLLSKGDEPLPGYGLKQAKSAALGDLRLAVKASLLRPRGNGFGLAVAEDLTFPTATAHNFTGDDGVTSTTNLIVDYVIKGWVIAANVGYRALKHDVSLLPNSPSNKNAVVSDELLIGGGINAPILCNELELIATVESRTKASDPFENKYSNALDVMGAAKYHIGNLSLLAGGGTGFLKGYGSPNYRVTLNVAWEPSIDKGCACSDADKDGVCDVDDKCPNQAGGATTGGCPDSDGDMVIDSEDRCPDKPGLKEFKGCPDTDKDGIPDIDDLCPTVPGIPQFQGCPDTDKDGIPDNKDKCPNDPGPANLEGCPDRDGDGVVDIEDKCPTVPGVKEYQGCPPPRVEVTKEKILIREKVFFETNKSIIKSESFGLLNEVAKVLVDHREIGKVRVEGHTDNVGKRPKNQVLSQNRAESVRSYLIKQGVDAFRLEAQGYADTVPLTGNDTDAGRSVNRRVEFTILEVTK